MIRLFPWYKLGTVSFGKRENSNVHILSKLIITFYFSVYNFILFGFIHDFLALLKCIRTERFVVAPESIGDCLFGCFCYDTVKLFNNCIDVPILQFEVRKQCVRLMQLLALVCHV